jgi:putative membrane-bound dehydrogenase-like protein
MTLHALKARSAALFFSLGFGWLRLSQAGAADQHPFADPTNYIVHAGVTVSLFASEPDVVSPVALTFDEAGRMYVVEMRDYPYGFGPQRKPGGTVRLLEDTNHDGIADRSTLFADHLSFPTSICPWNGGVLVASSPEILFLKDTDGDGKADVRQVIFRGFTLGVTDSNLNGFRWGLDNRVHGLNGGNGGKVESPRHPDRVTALEEMDFSFDPWTGDFATTFHSSGGFGLVFDDWGRSFVTYNINHIQHRFIAERYLRRFPGFPPVEMTTSISDHEDMARIFPISVAETRPNHPEQSGHFSSAGGMGYLGWNGFGPELYGSVFVCDVVGNLVHRDIIHEQGPGFRAGRAAREQHSEFFASRDNSFRPVGLESGPDGALYLIDMQRDVIEHPDYIPETVRSKLNLRAGEDRGRIYRIAPKDSPLLSWVDLGSASTAVLVQNLSHPSQWRRMTAQRLLVEHQSQNAAASLRQLARAGKQPAGRLHALWTLQGLKALDEPTLDRALSDPHPGVRENALLLAEPFLARSQKLSERVIAMADDAHPRVRFQAALTLGEVDLPEARTALRSILVRDYSERWTRLAVLSSLRSGVADLLGSLRSGERDRTNLAANLDMIRELADLSVTREGARGLSAAVQAAASAAWTEPMQLVALEGFQSGLARSSAIPHPDSQTKDLLDRLAIDASPALLAAAWRVTRSLGLPETSSQRKALTDAIRRARDNARPQSARIEDIGLLALGGYPVVKEPLFSLLDGNQPGAIQQAALSSLKGFNEPDLARNLVGRWRALAPGIRPAALNLLLQRQSFHPFLVGEMEAGRITVGELNLDLEQRRRLLRESTPEIEARAAKLIGDGEYSNRKALVGEWLAKLPATGQARRGQEVFEKICAQCHRVGNIGHRVGPELTGMSHRSVEDLLSNILDPNMAINPGYISYNCEMVSGELESGILQAESAEAVTLLQASEKKVVIARKNIKRLQSSGISLMPEGVEAGLTPENLRDVIAFLQESR